MDGLRFNAEHKEFAKDVIWLVINYTPLTGVLYTIKFGKKWIADKRMPARVANFMAEADRKSFIKSRSKRIMESRIRVLN